MHTAPTPALVRVAVVKRWRRGPTGRRSHQVPTKPPGFWMARGPTGIRGKVGGSGLCHSGTHRSRPRQEAGCGRASRWAATAKPAAHRIVQVAARLVQPG